MTDGTQHTTIWLQPWCYDCDRHCNIDGGRQWCQDDVWEPCDECGALPVKYMLAPDQPKEAPFDDGETAK